MDSANDNLTNDPFAAKAFYTPTEVAALFKVSPVTVRQWAQKGQLDAQTTAGGHRRFTPEALRAFAASRGIRLAGSTPRLLVVDDNRQFNQFLVNLFAARCPGVTTASAYDGFEAGRLVQQFAPTVVLLDIMMPGLDGVEVCRRLKDDPQTANLLIVAMTGYFSPELESRVTAVGAKALLRKPFSGDDAIAACELTASVA